MLVKFKAIKDSLMSYFGKSRLTGVSIMGILLTAVVLFVACSLNRVTVNDGLNTKSFYTLKSSTDDLVRIAAVDGNHIITDVTSRGKKISISLAYTFPVYVTAGSNTHSVEIIKGQTVADAILKAGISLDEHDIVSTPVNTPLSGTAYIDVTDINYITETYQETIPYTSKTVYSNKTSTKSVTTKGEEGVKENVKVTKLVNGVEESSEIVSSTVLKEAVTQIVTVGTKKPSVTTSAAINTISTLKPETPIELDANGNPVNYVKHITVQATAYSGDSHTASGMTPQPGCVAINTKLFPYGTKFYIKSSDGKYIYGYAVAADTGGFVATRPTNFDLYFPTKSECIQFGRRNIEVWVLE